MQALAVDVFSPVQHRAVRLVINKGSDIYQNVIIINVA